MTVPITTIAEIGQNFNGDLVLAKELIWAASESGANVAKFQLFNAAQLFSKHNNPWYEYNLSNELTLDQVYELSVECDLAKIEFMATPFDNVRVSWLEEIGVSRYKLASRSIQDFELIRAIQATGKPIIASLGMWPHKYFPEWLTLNGVTYFLHCISKYPTNLDEVKMAQIDFSSYSGFSDHTVGIDACLIALSRGARIIEKHFTLSKKMFGPDHAGSAIPIEMKQICDFVKSVEECL